MKRKSSMRNPRNRSLYRINFEATHVSIPRTKIGARSSVDRGTEDACSRRKRVSFAEETDCPMGARYDDPNSKLNSDAPKTSEYAFFKKLRQDLGTTELLVHTDSHITDESQSGDFSGDARPTESRSDLSPFAGPSKATDLNYTEQLDFRKSKVSHPIKKAIPVNFDVSSSPFRDPVRSPATNYVYGQGNIFSAKRDKLLQNVAKTYPESKELNLNGADLVNSMLRRLFPNGYDSKLSHRTTEFRQQDTCTCRSAGFSENNADCEEFHWSGIHGSREAMNLMLLDSGYMSSRTTEFSKWDGEYGMSPNRSTENECIQYKLKEPYQGFDYGLSRTASKNYFLSHSPHEIFKSHTSNDVHSYHPNNLPSRQKLLLGWTDGNTEDAYQLPIVPYDFDSGISMHSDCRSVWKDGYPLGSEDESRLLSFCPYFVSGHYDDIHSYFQALEDAEDYVTSNHLLEDMQNKRWDTINSRDSGPYVTTRGPDIIPEQDLHYVNWRLSNMPDVNSTPALFSSIYPKGQLLCIDQPLEVCGKEAMGAQYINKDCHGYADGAYQIGYPDEPVTDLIPYYSFP